MQTDSTSIAILAPTMWLAGRKNGPIDLRFTRIHQVDRKSECTSDDAASSLEPGKGRLI